MTDVLESNGRPTVDDRIRELARLTVRGVDMAPGQDVYIVPSDVDQAPLARAIAEEAYAQGAHFVSVLYWDQHVKRSRLLHAPADSLEYIPSWWERHVDECWDRRGCYISIWGDQRADVLDGTDPDRAARDRMPWATNSVAMLNSGTVNVAVIPGPTATMAERVLGTPDVERLWDALVPILRLDAPDPAQAWREQIAMLADRARSLEARRFTEIHFHGPGTDLRVGLLNGDQWFPSNPDPNGRMMLGNLPTEEVMATPDYRRVEGVARATRPLQLLGGPMVEGLQMRFEAGRLVEVDADHNADAMRALIARDEGAARLGEVALVDGTSMIARSGLFFRDTLLDENAACHVAIGFAYDETVPNLPDDPNARDALGFNSSSIHQDIMIGGPEIAVDGIDVEQCSIPILRDDVWVLDQP